MELFLYDVFITLNFIAFFVAVVDKCMCGSLSWLFWTVTFAFGGCGSGLACLIVRHHTRSGGAFAAIVLGIVQLFLLRWLRGIFFGV